MAYDVVALGELLIDFTCVSADADGYPTMAAHPGGAPANFLAAVTKFGGKTALLGKVGSDTFGRLLTGTLEKAGIETRGIVASSDVFTTLAFVTLDEHGDREFAFSRKPGADTQLRFSELELSLIDDTQAFHFGTLSLTDEPARATTYRAVAYAKTHGKLITFDPNLRKELRNDAQMRQRMMQMLSMADVIEPTLEEARIITGCTEISDVLRALHAAGPRLVVLTRDKDGALFSFDGQILSAEGIDVPVVDPTGAGDTFAAALACCIEENMQMEAAIAFCNCAGTLVCTKRGAIGMAIPTREQVLDMMRLHPARLHMESLQALYEKEHKHEIA